MTERLLVIKACSDCVHSRETSACFHPKTEERLDQNGDAPFNDGSGQPLRCFRALPPVPPGKGGFPEYQSPPDWCPLPEVDEVDESGELELGRAALAMLDSIVSKLGATRATADFAVVKLLAERDRLKLLGKRA